MKRIAVITGASSGIGREFVLSLKNHGDYDEVWTIARNKGNLTNLQPIVPFTIKPLSLDLTDPQSFAVYEETLRKEKPEIALLINASGFGIFNSVEDSKMEDLEGMIDLNCKALVKMTKLSLPYMVNGAKIIQIASIAAFQPIPYMNVYGASKSFVLSFSRALNEEIKRRGIQCMAVCPYWTRTRFFDRATAGEKNKVVKKYVVMYEPEQIVERAWKDLEKGRSMSIYGLIAKGQALCTKVLPHDLIMHIWKKQQQLD